MRWLPLVEVKSVLVVQLGCGLLGLAQGAIANEQGLHLRAHEAAEGVLWRAHDRLAAHVETRVHEHGAPSAALEGLNERVVTGVRFLVHGLDACGIVYVGYGWDVGTQHVALVITKWCVFCHCRWWSCYR